MQPTHCWRRGRFLAAVAGLFLCGALAHGGKPGNRLDLDRLEGLSLCELTELFQRCDVGTPLHGCARGRLVYLTDRRARLKMRLANSVWRGKYADADGHFVNRWIGGVRAIGSRYHVGPSWIDGRDAVIMEYAPGTALFWNMHDELREVAPGLYIGPVFERFPCPKLRGFIALQLEPCQGGRFCRR